MFAGVIIFYKIIILQYYILFIIIIYKKYIVLTSMFYNLTIKEFRFFVDWHSAKSIAKVLHLLSFP